MRQYNISIKDGTRKRILSFSECIYCCQKLLKGMKKDLNSIFIKLYTFLQKLIHIFIKIAPRRDRMKPSFNCSLPVHYQMRLFRFGSCSKSLSSKLNSDCFNNIMYILFIFLVLHVSLIQANSFEDARCLCTCTVVNGTHSQKEFHITNVPPNNDCDSVPLPLIDKKYNKTEEVCPRCVCNYESRNTNIIKIVVAIVIWIISLLVIYMFFLLCLDPLLNKRAKSSYVEHTNEEDDASVGPGAGVSSHQMGVRGNVLDRVGHQQDKWKKQVREQRKNIYDRHTMLN